MGQKTHPIGLRLGIIKTWDSRWFAKKDYANCSKEDLLIRKRYLKHRLANRPASPRSSIERRPTKVTITIHTARPGMVIGRKGAQVDQLRDELQHLTKKDVYLDIKEVKQPRPRRAAGGRAHRPAARAARVVPPRDEEGDRLGDAHRAPRASDRAARGRLGGAEMSRDESYREGRVPLHTLRADIDYARATRAHDLRHDRGQGLDLQRRSARGRRSRPAAGRSRDREARSRDAMLMPKRVKYRKQQRGRMRGMAYRGRHGRLRRVRPEGARAGWVTNRQIEAARVAITRSIKRGGKMWIRIFPDKPITKKPAETRMGKGKGAPGVLGGGRQARAGSCSSSRASRRKPPRPRCGWAPRSCRSGRASSSASNWEGSDMAGKSFRELENLSPVESELRLSELREELFNLRFRNSMRQLDNPLKIRALRRDIARVLTLLRGKQRRREARP